MGQPLSTKGKWGVGATAPNDCPQTTETCVGVFYSVAEAGVICEWTVVLFGGGSQGNVIGENDDANRYFLAILNRSDAAELLLERKQPLYPSAALAKKKSGVVRLTFVVGSDGLVEKVFPEEGSLSEATSEMTVAAIDSMKRWRFKPFTVGKHEVRFISHARISFDFDKKSGGVVSTQP